LNSIEYKYIKLNGNKDQINNRDIIWEEGGNRKINLQKFIEDYC
jgi:hypothetical protein